MHSVSETWVSLQLTNFPTLHYGNWNFTIKKVDEFSVFWYCPAASILDRSIVRVLAGQTSPDKTYFQQ
jgi:hypothetical protein